MHVPIILQTLVRDMRKSSVHLPVTRLAFRGQQFVSLLHISQIVQDSSFVFASYSQRKSHFYRFISSYLLIRRKFATGHGLNGQVDFPCTMWCINRNKASSALFTAVWNAIIIRGPYWSPFMLLWCLLLCLGSIPLQTNKELSPTLPAFQIWNFFPNNSTYTWFGMRDWLHIYDIAEKSPQQQIEGYKLMSGVITLWESLTKWQTIIIFIMNGSDELPQLPTDFISSQHWVCRYK